jgi:hypothetical protein
MNEEEMKISQGLSTVEGRRLDAFFTGVTTMYERAPDPGTAARHMAAIMEAVRVGAEPVAPVPLVRTRRRLHVVFAFAAAFLTLGILVAGLSYAGVITLPSPVRGVFHFMHLDQQAPGTQIDPAGTRDGQPPAPSPGASVGASPLGTNGTAGPNQGGPPPGKGNGDSPNKKGADNPGGSDGGDSPNNPGGDSCQLTGADIQNCLP